MAGFIYDPVHDTDDTFNNFSSTNTAAWRTVAYKYIDFCSKVRKDCMCILSAPRHMVLEGNQKVLRKTKPNRTFSTAIAPKLPAISGLNSSYAALYTEWFNIVDDWTGVNMWIPESIKACGVYVRTDRTANIWDAPAGLNRGVVSGVVDLTFNPTIKEADQIYLKGMNYARRYPVDGIVIEGQKTTQAKPSAFDRVNVRRLFLRLERMVYQVARYFVYEPNNLFTRRRFINVIDPIFRSVKSSGGLYDYLIVCDETNNTPQVIDNNEMKVAILLKPVRTAEFILIDFVATRTDANFTEVLQEIL